MNDTAPVEQLLAALEELRAQVASLSERLAKLEHPGSNGAAAKAAPAIADAEPPAEPSKPEAGEEISPDVLLAISAAVAAYLGERAHIRAVRLLSTTRWSQEGRVSIQASHRLDRS